MTKPFLFDLVNKLYHGIMDHAPKSLQEHSELSALVLGSLGSYILFRGVQKVSSKFFPKFSQESLPYIEKGCEIAITLTPLMYTIINPAEVYKVIREHPTYTSGMVGAWLGSISAATEHIIKSKKRVNEQFNYLNPYNEE